MRVGHLVSFDGQETYMPHLDKLNLPITFIHGSQNACFAPESTQETFDLLCSQFDPKQYSRHIISGYGHIDCIFGKNAHRDVYPFIVNHLDRFNA